MFDEFFLFINLFSAQSILTRYEWGSWIDTSTCNQPCGSEGVKQQARSCGRCRNNDVNEDCNSDTPAPSYTNCGSLSELIRDDAPCNRFDCPEWTPFGNWTQCSADCNGGIRRRSRSCSTGNLEDCGNEPSMIEEQCNTGPCRKEMEYWYNKFPINDLSGQVFDANLTSVFFQNLGGSSIEEKCASYCLFNDCFAMQVTNFSIPGQETESHCFITLEDPFAGDMNQLDCWGTTCIDAGNLVQTNVFGIFRDKTANPDYLQSENSDGIYQVAFHDFASPCEKNYESAFGEVDFRNTFRSQFETEKERNIIRETIVNYDECAASCFDRAGCSSFFQIGSDCFMTMGPTKLIESSAVSTSGRLTNFCPNSAFTNGYSSRSEFYCLFDYAGSTPEASLGDGLVDIANWYPDYDIPVYDFPLNEWVLEEPSGSPLIAKSQFIELTYPTSEDSNGLPDPLNGYRYYKFTIETHTRQKYSASGKKRRSGSSTALEELKTNENSAISYIMTSLPFPADFSLLYTSPVINIYTKQVSSDGSTVADCSSGSCNCSRGYIDNGDGCEVMTVEQVQSIGFEVC